MPGKETVHKSVLLKETIDGLGLSSESVLIDGTFGGGGHSRYALSKYPGIKIIAIDQDRTAFERFKKSFQNEAHQISFYNLNFRDMDQAIEKEGIRKVNAIMLDLGLSSDQLESSGRGFSFLKHEPLLMTMKENPGKDDVTAIDVVNSWSEASLIQIIRGYGEERFASRIARAIVKAREKQEIKTTGELIQIIESAIPARLRNARIHPATKTFQAIRIAVNDELRALEAGLQNGFNSLGKKGRMAVISFHSLEDRIVKKFFKEREKVGEAILINKKPIIAKNEEIKTNPRSRSAKLRVIEKII